MEHLRTFISIPLPHNLSKKVASAFRKLPIDHEKLRIVDEDNLHITLKFIGDTPLDRLKEIMDNLDDAFDDSTGADIEITHGACLPTRKPSALICSILMSEELSSLHSTIDSALAHAGISQPDRRRFHPHITIARVKRQATLTPEEIAAIEGWNISAAWRADKVVLYESKLSSSGPTYTSLHVNHLA